MRTLDLGRWKLVDPSWARLDLTGDEPRIFGSARISADDAWSACQHGAGGPSERLLPVRTG